MVILNSMTELGHEPVKRIIKKTDKRASRKATERLNKILEQKGIEISRKASELAEHAGRKTIKEEDIEKAVEQINQNSKY